MNGVRDITVIVYNQYMCIYTHNLYLHENNTYKLIRNQIHDNFYIIYACFTYFISLGYGYKVLQLNVTNVTANVVRDATRRHKIKIYNKTSNLRSHAVDILFCHKHTLRWNHTHYMNLKLNIQRI
jgi:hypothetical protein